MNKPQVFCAAMAIAACFALNACSERQNREDFTSQLKNKTEPEVTKIVGKPERVDSSDPKRVLWIYKSRTFDVATRNTDAETDVIFVPSPEDNKLHVTDVTFK
jgi:hypothetical protein